MHDFYKIPGQNLIFGEQGKCGEDHRTKMPAKSWYVALICGLYLLLDLTADLRQSGRIARGNPPKKTQGTLINFDPIGFFWIIASIYENWLQPSTAT